MPCARTERTTASAPLINGMRVSDCGLLLSLPGLTRQSLTLVKFLRRTDGPPGSKPGGDAVAAVASASYRNRVYPTLIRQVERRQRLLPLRGFGGEEAREGLVVLVGRRRRQRVRGGLRARRGENGGDLARELLDHRGRRSRGR